MTRNGTFEYLNSSNLTVDDFLVRSINQTNFYYNEFLNNSQRTFLITLLISSGPFLLVVLLIMILFAILRKIFTCRKTYKRKQNAKHIKLLENYLTLITESNDTDQKIEREKAFIYYALKTRTKIKNQVIPHTENRDKRKFHHHKHRSYMTSSQYNLEMTTVPHKNSWADEPLSIVGLHTAHDHHTGGHWEFSEYFSCY